MFILRYAIEPCWARDNGFPGAPIGPSWIFKQSANVAIPGGDTLTAANIYLALTGSSVAPPIMAAQPSLGADIGAQMIANLVRLQSWSSGGG